MTSDTTKTVPLWAVNIQGPDDLIAVPDYVTAITVAHKFNEWWLGLVKQKGQHEHDPYVWAVPIVWRWDATAHADSITRNADGEYAAFTGAAT